VDWVAEIWHGKNWVRRLLLLDVLLFIASNPYFPTVLKLIPGSFIHDRYNLYFWAVGGLFFVIELIIGIRHGTGLLVLTLTGDWICAITRFDNSALQWFGLPRSLPER
jgi:hypothetical protein